MPELTLSLIVSHADNDFLYLCECQLCFSFMQKSSLCLDVQSYQWLGWLIANRYLSCQETRLKIKF